MRDNDIEERMETMTRCANILSCALAAAGANETNDPETLVGAALVALSAHISTANGISKNESTSLVYSLAESFICQTEDAFEAAKG